jgi:hypothetical protein
MHVYRNEAPIAAKISENKAMLSLQSNTAPGLRERKKR